MPRKWVMSPTPARLHLASMVAIDRHIDQARLGRLNSVGKTLAKGRQGLNPLAAHAQRVGETDEIDRRIVEVHCRVAAGLLGAATQRAESLLQDAIGAIAEDHEHDRDALVRRAPQRLDAEHRPAVADQ